MKLKRRKRPQKVFCAYDKMIPIKELIPNLENPNTHPKSQIKLLAKIIKQGWRAPITVSNLSGLIVRGHGRLDAAKMLGLDKAPVDFQDYNNEAEEWADLLADNKLAELAEIDDDKLLSMLEKIDEQDFDMELTGFDIEDFGVPEMLDNTGGMSGAQYGLPTGENKIPINILGVGGMVDRDTLEEVKERLIADGAVEGEDNGELLKEMFLNSIV